MAKNTINKNSASAALNNCFKTSDSYNEAVMKFFEGFICDWLEIKPSELPSEPKKYLWKNEDGTHRVLPKSNLLDKARLAYLREHQNKNN